MTADDTKSWYKYPAAYTAIVWGGALALFLFFWISVFAAAYVSALSGLTAVFGVAFGGWLVIAWLLNYVSAYGVYRDAGALGKQESGYSPLWVAWVVAHLAIGPLAAPIYLYRRHRRVGNDYSGTVLGGLPVFGSRI